MKIVITGGTGTVGKALAQRLSDHEVVIFSRNEDAQIRMKKEVPCSYFVGDVRDYQECLRVTEGVDWVYHLAAMKHVGICESQPQEAAKTNILGTMNIVNASRQNGVKQLMFLSTDKAVFPINTYGATKMAGERIVLDAGYTVLRSGNILGSSNSIIPILKEQIKTGKVTISDGRATRFFIDLNILLEYMTNESLMINQWVTPSMFSFKLITLVKAMTKKYGTGKEKIVTNGLGIGEKLHEYIVPDRCSKDYLIDWKLYENLI
jgi:UDP-N-acetylglucosamine 4,6-dehydratase